MGLANIFIIFDDKFSGLKGGNFLGFEGNTMTTLLTNFFAVFSNGINALTGPALSLLATLMTISLALNHLTKLEEGNHIWMLVLECFKFGFFIWVVQNYQSLTQQVLQGFIYAGSLAGGGGVTEAALKDPSAIASMGWTATQSIFDQISSTSFFTDVAMTLFAVIVGLMIIISYFIIAVQVFITYLEFYLIGAIALILVPFGVLKHTSFLGEKALGAIAAAGVKIMVLTFILSAALPIMQGVALPPNPTAQQCLNLFGACLCVVFLCWQAPSLAAGLMSGSPVLSGGAVAGTAVSGLSAVALGAAAMKGAQGPVASALNTIRSAVGKTNGSNTLSDSSISGGVTGGSGASGSSNSSSASKVQSMLATAQAAGAQEAGLSSSSQDSSGAKETSSGGAGSGTTLNEIIQHAKQLPPQEASPTGGLQASISHDDR